MKQEERDPEKREEVKKYPNSDKLEIPPYSETKESDEREYAITHMLERARSMRGTPHSFRI